MAADALFDVFAGGGELGERMRAIDWASTSLGPVETWPQSLRTCVRIILTSSQPMFVWWGDELINLYNDAYCSILAGKHPSALGKPAAEVWREIWGAVGPRAQRAMRDNQGTFDEALLLIMERSGYREETYYTFSYSPVPGDRGEPGGILCANSSDTQRIFGERQQALLREVSAATAEARTPSEVCERAARALASNPRDLPFAALFTIEDDAPRVASTTGIAADHPLLATLPVGEAIASRAIAIRSLAGATGVPTGAWDEPAREAIALPIAGGDRSLAAVLVVARNPFRRLDDDYRRFLELLAVQIGSALANAQAYEAERRRAEGLAELDRAKTTFFSNISHEFRTPLTLMIGPTEDALRKEPRALAGESLDAVYRNELRLLKLVNALLDFSRIEAGRVRAQYEAIDLAQYTRELASAFRSAMERAGLRFEVATGAIDGLVSVDRSMWEKIVLNLLSNALKFTFAGEVTVQLADRGSEVELVVADTGTGIPAEELPHLFERFHRVDGARSRTHEGSGIGLALSHELVKLHRGSLTAESELGRGTRFTVRIPKQADAGLVAQPRTASSGVSAFVEEALRWLPEQSSPEITLPLDAPPLERSGEAKLLVADDNADMRDYLRRLLGERWNVTIVADGRQALEAARRDRPDLVLTDVMMPELDGFGLLDALRADPDLASVPVVMLSARAGEEARVEGIEAGADDYLVKPFSARELIARVSNMLQLARLRREVEVERNAAEAANRAKDEFLAMLGHELRNPLAPILTALELMRMRGLPSLERERTIIERQTRHLASLVDDLLDVSRITRGMIQLKREHVALSHVIAKAIETASPLFEQQRHELVTDVRVDFLIDADEARLTQVFANLLTNAAKYTDPGGRVTITARQDAHDVVVSIADTGRGIDPDILPHVFDLFVQERQNIDRSQGGLGLGLAIVRSLVLLHGGRVDAASAGRGHGSTFEVRLPLLAVSAQPVVVTAPLPAAARSGVSVLIVDDNIDAAELLSDLLASRGYDTRVAHDAPQALALAQEFVPDVALLDIGLPAMDGYELARRLRAIPPWQGVRLFAVTGYGQLGDRERSKESGFDHHLVKPIDFAALQDLMPPARSAP